MADRYRLEPELGRGGMATVYLAHDLKHDRPVALKVLKPELARVLGPERFLREIRLTAQLDQPHILPLLDSGDADGFLHIAREVADALEGLPNDARLWGNIAATHRRLGNWDQVLAAFEKATQLNPRDANLFDGLGGYTYRTVHRYAEAVRAFDRALSLAPDLHGAAVAKGWTVGVFEGVFIFLPSSLYAAWAHQLRGDRPAARAAFDSARVVLDSVIRERPDDWRVHAARGLAQAGLGRRAEALGEARWLQQSVVYREDALQGPQLAEERARILAQAGEAEVTRDEIERLLARPSELSVHTLGLDPLWDSIRNHPRFKALLAKYAAAAAP